MLVTMVPTRVSSNSLLLLMYFLLLVTQVFNSFLSAAAYSNQTTIPPAPCLPSQASKLLRFKREFAFNSNFFKSWQPGTDCCDWRGVGCDAGDGRVTLLDLAGMDNWLRHGLGKSLFHLTSLKYLNLSKNYFSGIPLPTTGFERLTQLTHLNLSDTNIAGQIPASIGRLKNLVSLDLSTSFSVEIFEYHNEKYLVGTGGVIMPKLRKPNLPSLLANLSNLRKLRLGYVDLSNMGTKWCEALAEYTPKLEVLNLPFCSLSGSICASLSRIRSLSEIDLRYNNLEGMVPEFLADLPSLSVLRLSSNDFEGWFPPRILKHKKLAVLDVRNNTRLCGNLPNFPTDSSLRNLVVRRTNFSGNIPSSISNLKSLESLDLASTGFSGELPCSISALETLNVLAVSGFGLVGSFPSWVTNLSLLTVLEFSNCGLSGSIPPDLLCSFYNLETLVLNNCNFSGAIPSCIPDPSQESQLNTIVFRSNSFVGQVELSPFWNLLYLGYFDLSNNGLVVVDGNWNFSSDLSQLPQIRQLLLASCKLPAFPTALRFLNYVEVLDLSDNQISGAIPKWVWRPWYGLQVLNLSHNLLTHAELFHTVLPFNWLYSLDLSFNLFKGAILVPRSYSTVLDYSNNNFSSIEPTSVAYLCDAYVIKVSRNNLSGVISPSLCCAAKSLKILDLSYNNLGGSIPSCLIGANALTILSLRANMLHGEFPVLHNISNSCNLEFIDVNNNSIHGQLPRSLASCKNLEMLDVGNNHISDSFPCWLSILTKLQVLVLKSNNFFGHVGAQTSNCGFCGLRILELASNNFSGTLQDQWLTSFRSMIIKPDTETSVMTVADQNLAYQFTVTLTFKGAVDVTITRISNALVVIDFSDNELQGSIPEAIGKLVLLRSLNMSRNRFIGLIPSQFGGMHQLEAMDLSWNELTGRIPQELASMDFLQVLNLSYNKLVGRIPDTPHFLTFPGDSFLGNPGLCGSQLFIPCDNKTVGPSSNKRSHIVDIFLFLFVGVGFGLGLAIIITLRWGFHTWK